MRETQTCLNQNLAGLCGFRFASRLADAHNAEHLGKFEELLEAAIDLDRIPDEYLIAASYDPQLEARLSAGRS